MIVDDEPEIVNVIEDYLIKEGYQTITAFDGMEALKKIELEKPDLIVLDWMLPGISGIHICQELRRSSSIPIIMLTAKSEEADRVQGLEFGADDYVVKPFGLRELVARIRTVLRRTSPGNDLTSVILHGEIKIDVKAYRVWKRDVEVVLTPTEFKILSLWLHVPGLHTAAFNF